NHLSAILNYRKALSFNGKVDVPEIFGVSAEALGDLYGRIQYNNNALHFYSESQKSFEDHKDLYRSFCVQNKIAAIYYDVQNLSEALKYYDASLDYFKSSDYKVEEASTLLRIAEIYFVQ